MRDHFEVSAEYIAHAAISALVRDGEFEDSELQRLSDEWGIGPNKTNPVGKGPGAERSA